MTPCQTKVEWDKEGGIWVWRKFWRHEYRLEWNWKVVIGIPKSVRRGGGKLGFWGFEVDMCSLTYDSDCGGGGVWYYFPSESVMSHKENSQT
jgi:hypothetical protein